MTKLNKEFKEIFLKITNKKERLKVIKEFLCQLRQNNYVRIDKDYPLRNMRDVKKL